MSMTHDELLTKIGVIGEATRFRCHECEDGMLSDEEGGDTCFYCEGRGYYERDYVRALRAVVELHKPEYWQNPNVPEWHGAKCTHCLEEQGDYMSPISVDYPCPTIQAIEKELK